MMRQTASAVLVLTFSFYGCQKGDDSGDSTTQSLDNLIRGDGVAISYNSCGLDLNAASYANLSKNDRETLERRISASSDAARYAAAGALFAVPQPLQSMFFGLDGEIKVVSSAQLAVECADAALSEAESAFASEGEMSSPGCWDVKGSRLVIYLVDEPVKIKHAMVRLFAYVYTRSFMKALSRTDLPSDKKAEADAALARYESQKNKLWDAILIDLESSQSAKERLVELANAHEASAKASLFSDVTDSFYCSKKTRDDFERVFNNTYRAFTEGPSALQKDFGKAFYE